MADMSGTPSTGRWNNLRRSAPKTTVVVLALLALFVAIDVVLVARWVRYRNETRRLRAAMTDAERERADMVLASEKSRTGVMLELIRRQAAADRTLHLAVATDSGKMVLERDGALLREMDVEIGAERVAGMEPDTQLVVRPRGARTVERILSARDPWEVPRWVYADRGLPIPDDRQERGVLGRNALVLSGGTVIYALPDSGLLADSSYVLPGAIRARQSDLRAIAPNITPGVTVYLYE